MTSTPTAPAVTVERIDDADVIARYETTARDVLYRVTGRRVSGVVAAAATLNGEGAPHVRAYDPHRGYWSGEVAAAQYPGVWLTCSPRGKGTGWDSTDDERHPDALTANGRRITDATRHVHFHPVAVDERNGEILTRTRWHQLSRDAAQRDAARYGDVFADNVIGTDGRRVSGVFVSSRGSFDSGLTDAGRRVVDAVAMAVVVDMFGRAGADAALVERAERSVKGDETTARERAERWQTRAGDLAHTAALIADRIGDVDGIALTVGVSA